MATWGEPNAHQRALLIHGLSASGASWWRIGEALAAEGWFVAAPDLRGHGTAAPADTYRISDYVSDLPAGPWNFIIGHSLGGAIAASLADRLPESAIERLILLDPLLDVPDTLRAELRAGEIAELDLTEQTLDKPHWHHRDRELKLEAVRQADPRMVAATFDDNPSWNAIAAVQRLRVPTLVLTGDPAVFSMVWPATATAIQSPTVHLMTIAGAGHSPHRDRPAETLAAMMTFVG